MKIKDISKINGREVITITPNTDLPEAIKQLVNHQIGAMPVCDFKGKLVGILSERDVLRWIHKGKPDIKHTKVKDIMTSEVMVGDPEDNLEDILKTMTTKGVRHLPVMAGTRVVGMLSLRDVIEEQLTECSSQVRYLNEYISGGHTQ